MGVAFVVVALTAAGGVSFAVATLLYGPKRANHLAHADRTKLNRHTQVAGFAGAAGSNGSKTSHSPIDMMMSQASDLGTFGAGAAAVHLMSVPTSSGGSCLVSERADGGRGASCLDTPSLLTSRPVEFLEESSGGPDPSTIDYLRVVGVAQPGVDVEVQLSSGATEAVTTTSKGAFDYEEPLSTIHAGDLPSKLLAYRGGQVIATYPL